MLEVELFAWGILSVWVCRSTMCTAPAGLVQEHAAEVDSIAVITGYKGQEKALRARFADEAGLKSISSVYFGTVDGFQVSTLAQHIDVCLCRAILQPHSGNLRWQSDKS